MSKLPPEWAMAGQALDSAGDPHLSPGIHFRLATSPKLGLPLRPLAVYRINYGPSAERAKLRSDITWADSYGRVLAVPFTLTPGMEVYGHLPVDATTRCVWFQVQASLKTGESLRVEALRNTDLGPAVLAARDRAPFEIGSSYTQLIRVTGSGTVTGARWLDGKDVYIEQLRPWLFLGLPVERAARYEGLAGAPGKSDDRVKFGAPLRMGLHDEPGKPGPSACTAIPEWMDLDRVSSLTPGLWPMLDRLLNDLSAPQQDLSEQQVLTSGLPSSTPGEALLNCLGTVLGAALDPGLGRWLGFMDRDNTPDVVAGEVVLYLIRGYWAIDPSRLEPTQELPLLEAVPEARVPPTAPQDPTLPYSVPTKPVDKLTQLYEFRLPVATTVGAPPLPPGSPGMGPARNGEGPWQPLTPPLAQRELIVPVRHVLPGACMAFARKEGSTYRALNDRTPNGRAATLLVAQADDAEQPQSGELFDREAPETLVEYRAAQADWFGRWSGWSTLMAASASRPKPPTPVLEAWYEKPALPSPMHSQPLWGRLTVKVPVPPVDNLAPGSYLLDKLRITGDIQGTPVTLEVPVPAASFVEVEVPCPSSGGQPLYIDRCQSAQARLQAQWLDTAGQTGSLSQVRTLTLVDPRPPESVVMDPSLRYSARPDATGRARVTLSWQVQGQQRRYRVYVCDETRLVSAMEKRVAAGGSGAAAAQDFLNAWSAATTPAERGAAFTDRASLFERELFENLTGEPLEVSGSATTLQYQHDLSGSLRVLTLYRVVSLSENNVESPFLDSPLVPYGVPNSGPPPRPLLELVPEDEIAPESPLPAGALRLRVQIIRGAQPAARYRLRRSSVSGEDALRMPVAREDAVPLPEGWESTEGAVTFDIDDTGAYVHEPGAVLRPWTRYYWRVELQAPSEPGSTVPGQWSPPSAAVSGLIVPAPPQAPTLVSLNAAPGEVRWTHSEPLTGGAMGRYRFDVYRRTPGGREERIGSVVPDAPAAEGGRDSLGQFFFIDTAPVSGSAYRVVVYDPIGRMSPPSAAMTLP